MHLLHSNKCAICSSTDMHPLFDIIDYTVSKEKFTIWHCENCSFRFTQDIPTIENMGFYYQSSSYISHSNTKQGLVNKLYHLVRKYTLAAKADFMKEVTGLKQGRLLDIGAGTGSFAYTMEQKAWNVTALEPDEKARIEAKKQYGLELSSPDRLFEMSPNSFDAITLWHVMEHVHDLKGYWNQFGKILSRTGRLIIAVPNYTASDAVAYGKYWAAYDVPRHLYHFSPKSMQLLGKLYGFKLIATKAMWFDAFYVCMLSEQYKNGHLNLMSAFWRGLWSNLKAISDSKKCSSVIYIYEKN